MIYDTRSNKNKRVLLLASNESNYKLAKTISTSLRSFVLYNTYFKTIIMFLCVVLCFMGVVILLY